MNLCSLLIASNCQIRDTSLSFTLHFSQWMSKRNRLKESDDSLPCPTASSLRPFSRPELGTYPQGDLSSSPGAKDENAVVGGKATDVVADEASLDVVEVLNVDIFLEILQYRSLSLCLGLTAPDGLLIAIC